MLFLRRTASVVGRMCPATVDVDTVDTVAGNGVKMRATTSNAGWIVMALVAVMPKTLIPEVLLFFSLFAARLDSDGKSEQPLQTKDAISRLTSLGKEWDQLQGTSGLNRSVKH